MTRMVSAEIFKLRSTRTFYAMAGSAIALVLLIVVIAALTADKNTITLRDLIGISGFAQVFALLLGILSVTSEFRHGTITPTLLAEPNRVKLTLAKLVASMAVGVGLSIVATGLAALIGDLLLHSRGIDTGVSGSDVTKMLVGNVVAGGLYGALGVGVGAIVRNQVGAIVGTLVFLFVLEPLLNIVKPLRDPVAKYGFGGVGTGVTATDDPNATHHALSQVPAGLLLALYCAVLLVIGIYLMRKRDITS
jgi:ABC-2 type transport system permease protein